MQAGLPETPAAESKAFCHSLGPVDPCLSREVAKMPAWLGNSPSTIMRQAAAASRDVASPRNTLQQAPRWPKARKQIQGHLRGKKRWHWGLIYMVTIEPNSPGSLRSFPECARPFPASLHKCL